MIHLLSAYLRRKVIYFAYLHVELRDHIFSTSHVCCSNYRCLYIESKEMISAVRCADDDSVRRSWGLSFQTATIIGQ